MPNWKEVLEEIQLESQNPSVPNQSPIDTVRRKYLKKVFTHSNRNVIAYYSGWLQRPNTKDVGVNDKDVSGLMLNIHKLDRKKGLDLILHTPGGSIAATESIVGYLKKMFHNDIRAIVPQLSMSAGTMIALSCNPILMGKHSSLGPIDPQMEGVPCQAVIDEFDRAKREILDNPDNAYLWEFIISKYHPTFLSSCQQAIIWSNQLAKKWLEENMCIANKGQAKKIINHFSSHKKSLAHERHFSIDTAKKVGLNIIDLESDQDLQELILTVHHCFMHTFANTPAVKIIENHNGIAYIEKLPTQLPSQPPQQMRRL